MMSELDDHGPFHEGELALQRAAGEREDGIRNGRVIVAAIADRAVRFIAHQQLAVVATTDDDGQPWCSLLAGPPGTFRVDGPTTLGVDRRAATTPDDPLWSNLRHDPRIGVLFIEVESRRRYRVNGHVKDLDHDPLTIEVAEAYPNCPKYIRRRHLVVASGTAPAPTTGGTILGTSERRHIEAADTFFVASSNPEGNLDASHRGGDQGFVRVRDNTLIIPDYPGNGMFNTLGNLVREPRAGLLFVDFSTGDTLQLAGAVHVDLDADPRRTGGTGRAWTVTVDRWRRSRLQAILRHEGLETSPHNPPIITTLP